MSIHFRIFILLSLFLFRFSLANYLQKPARNLQDEDPNYDPNSDESTVDVNTEGAIGDIQKMSVSLGQKYPMAAQPCQRYDLYLNYSGFKVDLEQKQKKGQNPMMEILITDVELSTSVCDINAFNYCNHNAKLCLRKSLNEGEDENDEDFEVKVRSCLPSVFVYVYINSSNFTNDSLGKLDFKRIDSECDFASADDWSYCSALSDSKCKSDDAKVCDARCKWIQCTFKNRKKNEVEKIVSNCVPFTTMRKDDICEDYKDDENDMSPTSRHEDQTLFDFKYCGHALNFEILHPKKYSAGSIILFILVILMVLFILSICWYRWKITHHKQAPFTPPNCCPEWVYPRIQADEYHAAPNLE